MVLRMNLVFAFFAVLTFIAMGSDANLFVLWSLTPILLATFMFNKSSDEKILTSSSYHMVLGILLVHAFFHSVMFFDIGKAASGSSTSALAYVFFPIFSIVFGIMMYALSKLIKMVWGKWKT